ncbi:MAG: hypothetical protein ACXVDD_06320, partial [Polyangia bacterium]
MRRVPLVAAFAMMCAAACSSSSSDGGAGSGGGGGGGSGGDLGGLGASCTAPLAPADVSQPATVVGNGTAASCTAGALAAAIAKAGVITFDCGGAATITLTEQLVLSTTSDTIIDGGGHITIDGGGATRLFYYSSGNYRATHTTVTLQHLTLQNGKASGTMIPTAPPPCSQGFQIDGSGAAIFVRDGILHVLDVTFTNDAAASPGPDVGGGAIYANGSLGVVVADSRFVGNSGSNGGAIGSLNSDLVLVGNTFDGNHATGSGANGINNACTVNGGESGDGGNGGAVVIDGGSDGTVTTCGNLF